MVRSQTILESIFLFLIVILFFVRLPKIELAKFSKIEDIYASIIAMDLSENISYSKIEEVCSNLTTIVNTCCIEYYNKNIGNCNETYEQTLVYLVWDPELNRTVELKVKIK